MRSLYGVLILLAAAVPSTASAQAGWHLTLERGSTTFSAAAHDTSADQVQVRPWHPATYTFRLVRESRRLGFGVALTYSNGPVAANIDDFVLLPGDTQLLIELAPELRYPLIAASSGVTLRIHVGPVVDIWTPSGDDTRTVFGGLGGLTMSFPIAGRWQADLRADVAVTGSNVTKDEASDGIVREPTMRRGRLGIGITKRL